jgi:cellobiose PTS system EIIC component
MNFDEKLLIFSRFMKSKRTREGSIDMSEAVESKQGVFTKLQEKLMPIMGKISSQKHLSAIKNGIMFTIPFTIIGSLMMIIAQPPVNPQTMHATNFFFKFLLMWKAWATSQYLTLMTPYYLTMGILSVIAVIGISYSLAKSYKINEISAVLISTVTFLMVAAPFNPVSKEMSNVLVMPTSYLDSKGLFAAMIIGLISVEIIRILGEKNIKIKMPASVPPMVAAPFEALIPAAMNIALFFVINIVVMNVFGANLPQLIMNIFKPLVCASDSLAGLLFIYLLLNVLWIFGIHGGAVVIPIVMPLMISNTVENAQAYIAGKPMEHILTAPFHNIFANIGGSGAAIGLGIAILIVAKSAQLKAIGKIGIAPVLFNISEPLVFGTPIIMNPLLVVPVLLAPTVNVILCYFTFHMGIVRTGYLNIPNTIPGPIGAFLGTMDWKAIIFWFVLAAIDTIIYVPFVKIYDKTLVKKETKAANLAS